MSNLNAYKKQQNLSTSAEKIVKLKNEMQEEFDKVIGNCIVNIIVSDN